MPGIAIVSMQHGSSRQRHMIGSPAIADYLFVIVVMLLLCMLNVCCMCRNSEVKTEYLFQRVHTDT